MAFDVIGCAAEMDTESAFEAAVLEHLCAEAGAEVGFFLAGAQPRVTAVGMDGQAVGLAFAQPNSYCRELAPVRNDALAKGGVAVDTDFFGASRLRTMSYFRDLAAPIGGRHSMMGFLRLRGRVSGMLMLGRLHPRTFSNQERASFERLLPAVSVARASFGQVARCDTEQAEAPLLSLTRREHGILDLMTLGYRNAEIGQACGTSLHTVRNQIVSIFRKLGATTRSEAVALAMRTAQHPVNRSAVCEGLYRSA